MGCSAAWTANSVSRHGAQTASFSKAEIAWNLQVQGWGVQWVVVAAEMCGLAFSWRSSQMSQRWGHFHSVWYRRLQSIPWYVALLTVEFGATNFWYSMLSLLKNIKSITFMGKHCCLTLVFRAWPGDFLVANSCFSRGFHLLSQSSSSDHHRYSDVKRANFLRSGSCRSEFFEIRIVGWRSGAPTKFFIFFSKLQGTVICLV